MPAVTVERDAVLLQHRAAYDAAFQETLNKPGDPAANVRFAELAIQAGDYHGAIAALERLEELRDRLQEAVAQGRIPRRLRKSLEDGSTPRLNGIATDPRD